MRARRAIEQQASLDIYDLGVIPAVGPGAYFLYDVLCRFVGQTTEDDVDGEMEEDDSLTILYQKGLIATRLRQAFLAEYVGVQRQTVNQYLALLGSIGWIIPIEVCPGSAKAYALGQVEHGKAGGSKERYFIQDWLWRLQEKIAEAARNRMPSLPNPSPEDLPISDRVAIARLFVLQTQQELATGQEVPLL